MLAPWLPPGLLLDGCIAGGARGTLVSGKSLDLNGSSELLGGRIRYSRNGEGVDAQMEVAQSSFSWRGSVADVSAGKVVASARVEATALLTSQGRTLALEKSALVLEAGEAGVHARLDLALPGNGILKGTLQSSEAAGLALPETAELALEWQRINPAYFKGWLPAGLNLDGNLAGRAGGRLLPDQHLDLAGEVLFAQAKAQLKGEGGEMQANLRQAALNWRWLNRTLSGDISLELAGSGAARGSFELPIPARLPVAADPQGEVRANFAGKLQEKGVLSSLLPGLVQESHGNLDADIRVSGQWDWPKIEGRLQLTNAGGYLPTAGITLTEVQLDAELTRDLIRVTTFAARSGPGRIGGEALIRLNGSQVIGYQGSLKGERFQTIHLPELQLLSSPQLSFQGNMEKLSVRGEVVLPEMLISGPPLRPTVAPSKDVILVGVPAPAQKHSTLALDVQIRVTLGDKVLVKASGIDAKLGGGMDLVMKSLDRITSRGEIRVTKGNYRAYGLDLEIVKGRFYYAGGPIDQPTLDILALRSIGEVRAGVAVEGYLSAPVIKLYSEPPLPDVDILAYMVLGHPMGSSTEQTDLMSQAASALLSLGPADSVQEQIKDRLGLSVLGFESVSQSSSGHMGYKEIPISPTGAAQAKGVTTESMLTVGKYLTPKIFFSYGQSLTSGGSLFQLRYDITRRWQVETQTGSESGADIYYKMEFN